MPEVARTLETGASLRPVSRVINSADLAGICELSSALGVTRQAICNWAIRHADFPKPVVSLASGPVYLLSEVVAWYQLRKR